MTDVSVMLAAQSVAMRAMINDLDQHAVDDMRQRAEELLTSDSDLFRAITGFVTQYELARHEPGDLAMQGRILRDQVLSASGAVPEHRERRDIDG